MQQPQAPLNPMSTTIPPAPRHRPRQEAQLPLLDRSPVALQDPTNRRHRIHLELGHTPGLPVAARYQIADLEVTSDTLVEAFAPFRTPDTLPNGEPLPAVPSSGEPFAPFRTPDTLPNGEPLPAALTALAAAPLTAHGWLCGAEREVTLHPDPKSGQEQITIAQIGRFALLPETSTLRCLERASGITQPLFEEALLGPPLTLALARQQRWCLHAAALLHHGAALLLLGDSGRGKSTLADYGNRHGMERISDDILPVRLGDAGGLALPHFPQLKLSAAANYPRQRRSQIPIRALFFLTASSEPEPYLTPLSPPLALQQLLNQSVALRLLNPTLRKAQLHFAAQLLRHTPAYALGYRHDFRCLPEVLQRIRFF